MPFPSLAKIAATLSEADIQRLLVLKRSGPKLEKLEARRKKIADQLAEVEKELAALTGVTALKAPAKRGRKPGRPAKTTAATVKRGRPAKPGRKLRAAKAGTAKRVPAARRGPKTAKASRPAGDASPILEALTAILRDAGRPMPVREIVAALPARGVTFKTEKGAQLTAGRLLAGNPDQFKAVEKGVYASA